VADAGGEENGLIGLGEGRPQLLHAPDEGVHHLRDAEAVAEVVEGIRAVLRARSQLHEKKKISSLRKLRF
jgi:hypothetical protein